MLSNMSGYLLLVHGCTITDASRHTMVSGLFLYLYLYNVDSIHSQNPHPPHSSHVRLAIYNTIQRDKDILTRSRLFPYMVVSSALGVCFIFLIMVLASRHFLLPGIIIIGSFILLVLWLTGLIETSLQLYGVVGNVNDNCQIYVRDNKSWGNNINTLAWLTQSTICEFFVFLSPLLIFSKVR